MLGAFGVKMSEAVRQSVRRAAVPLVCGLLLAACGQNRPNAAAATSTDSYAGRSNFLAAQTTPADPLAPAQLTDLSTTLPAHKAISAQSIDKSVPIILVHGMAGFGRSDLGGLIKYWGGTFDVQEDLRSLGYNVFTAKMGPFSSNWDRAAELYAQIKGGCVDYGAARAAKFGHDRFDKTKCYAGFYPQWDAQHPVNLIGHSMGGPTARLLVKLLEDGSPENAASNNLFVCGRTGWVKNVMTISSPNSGSPAADNLQVLLPSLQKILISLAASSAVTGQNIYDFYLGQYHLNQQAGETFDAYVDRVMNSPIMTSKDSCGWDLRPDGSKELNAFIGRSKVTKYFSWATNDTSAGLLTGWHYPNITMNSLLDVTAYPYPRPMQAGLGNIYGSSIHGGVQYDSSWWPNDGLVPSNYMDAPLGEVSEKYSGQATQAGHWYALGRLDGYDHLDITGNLTLRDVKTFYRNQAAFISSQN